MTRKNLLKRIAMGLTGLALIAFSSCSSNNSTISEKEKIEIIRGKPLIANESSNHEYGSCVTIVLDNNGKKILAYSTCRTRISSKAIALVQSEMNDSDEEDIELTGKYVGKEFEIKSLKANGYRVEFR